MWKLFHGDCLQVMEERIKDESIDMIFADLPYQVLNCKWDKMIDLDQMWKQYERIIKPEGVIVFTASGIFSYELIKSNEKLYRYKWIWQKNTASNFINCNYRPLTSFEEILIFSKAKAANNATNRMNYFPQGLVKVNQRVQNYEKKFGTIVRNITIRKKVLLKKYTNYPRDILYFPMDSEKLFPSQKPIALLEYIFKTYSREKSIILDATAGSGSTGISAMNTNRHCIMIEIEKEHCNLIRKRMKDNGYADFEV